MRRRRRRRERREKKRVGGGGQGQPGRGVLTVSQAVAAVSLQAEILEHSEQLTATVDLGLAAGEQAA